MRTLKLIGIGAGNPEYITLQAINALAQVDVVFLNDKGPQTAELLRARQEICRLYMRHKPFRTIAIEDPERDRSATDYRSAVDDWHRKRAAVYETVIREQLADGECGAFLVWGDPSLYDSTLRIVDHVLARGAVDFEYEVIPGITCAQALTARHRIPLNDIGEAVHITTGRQLAEQPPVAGSSVLVLLDGQRAFDALQDQNLDIYWGAYLGTPDELLIAGKLTEVRHDIRDTRARARARKGWIMDTYLLRPRARSPDSDATRGTPARNTHE